MEPIQLPPKSKPGLLESDEIFLANVSVSQQTHKIFRSANEALEAASRLIPNLLDLQFLEPTDVHFSTSYADANGLKLASISTSENRIKIGHRPEATLVFPLAGGAQFCVDRLSVEISVNKSAAFIPTTWPTDISGGKRCVVVARVDTSRLHETAATMLGPQNSDGIYSLIRDPLAVQLQLRDISFDSIFRAIFMQIHHLASNPKMLNLSGLDDIFYRTLSMAVNPKLFLNEAESSCFRKSKPEIDRVCQWILANLGNRITLTDLERVAHRSRRSLQNAFVGVYGISPMSWVREQRLMAARAKLQSSYTRSVSEVLYGCGFTAPSLFCTHYFQRFGELPSTTLAKAKR